MQQTVKPDGGTPTGPCEKTFRFVGTGIEYCLMAVTLAMSAMISYQVVARYVFNAPSSATEGILRYSLIWLGLLGAAYCFIDNRHLNLPLLSDSLKPQAARRLQIVNSFLTITFSGVLLWGGYIAVQSNADNIVPLLRVPVGSLQTVLVVSGALIIVSQLFHLRHLVGSAAARIDAAIAIGVLALLALSWWAFRTTALYDTLTSDHVELFSAILLFGSFFVMLILGTPIAIALGLSGILTLSLQLDFSMLFSTSGERMFSSLNNFGFLALPFFILAGNIMNQGGIAHRLINFAMVIGKRIPGSLWQANILANMLFGCLSGSSLAASTAIGSMVSPIAREKNYDMPITTAVNATSAPSGVLIPPSGPFIVYSLHHKRQCIDHCPVPGRLPAWTDHGGRRDDRGRFVCQASELSDRPHSDAAA